MSENEPSQTSFNRIMLKISGEALMGDQGYGISPPTIERIAAEVKSVHDMDVQICMVIGGGNIFRGLQGFSPRYGENNSRLHGYARNGYERIGNAKCT